MSPADSMFIYRTWIPMCGFMSQPVKHSIVSKGGSGFSDNSTCTNTAIMSYICFSFLRHWPRSSGKSECLVSCLVTGFRGDFFHPCVIGWLLLWMNGWLFLKFPAKKEVQIALCNSWTCFASYGGISNFPSCWGKDVNILEAKTWKKRSEEEQWSIDHVDTDGCSKHYYSLMRRKSILYYRFVLMLS